MRSSYVLVGGQDSALMYGQSPLSQVSWWDWRASDTCTRSGAGWSASQGWVEKNLLLSHVPSYGWRLNTLGGTRGANPSVAVWDS